MARGQDNKGGDQVLGASAGHGVDRLLGEAVCEDGGQLPRVQAGDRIVGVQGTGILSRLFFCLSSVVVVVCSCCRVFFLGLCSCFLP